MLLDWVNKSIKKVQQQQNMDIFDFPDDYKPEHPLTKEEMDENTNYLLNHPLFMKTLPEDPQSNEHIKALMLLKEDEDPNEVAQNLNSQANKKLKQSPNGLYHMKQAYSKYTEAINIKCPSAQINAKVHANRAQLNLKLRNYGKVVQDCNQCLKFDANYVKGYYRYAKALIALEKYQDCIELLILRSQQQLSELLKQAKQKKKTRDELLEKKKDKKQEKQNQIKTYCVKKGWKYLKRDQPLPEGVKAEIKDSELSIPLIILYPQFNEFDLIASTFETHKIKQNLKQIMQNGLPWDAKKQYSLDNIQIYCQVSEAVLMKVPKQTKIGDILTRVPFKQALEVQVVTKNNTFYNSYLSQHKII